MQREIDAEALPTEVSILGVNDIGFESGNAAITTGRSLPWLQATTAVDVWASWAVTFRDVVILLPDNSVFAVYNLTANDLADPAHRDELKALLRDAATP